MSQRSKPKSMGTLSSIEGFTRVIIASGLLLVGALLMALLVTNQASLLVHATCYFGLLCLTVASYYFLKRQLITPFYSFTAILEAIRREDYSMRATERYSHGVFTQINQEVIALAEGLQDRKSHYDQQAILVFRLIEQLATPIIVLDDKQCLYHANNAFSVWCKQPWETLKGRLSNVLGLNNNSHQGELKWQFNDPRHSANWQLRFSKFNMNKQDYHLLIMTNIEHLVQQTEQQAFHKMTKVLTHEINNSLAPINSLAQSLSSLLADNPNVQEALNVIINRSDGLMTFVNRYANLSKDFQVTMTALDLPNCIDNVITLFDQPIGVTLTTRDVYADAVLLEQVLINLIKNALEASHQQQSVEINAYSDNINTYIEVTDSGTGIANTDNLFVPFYTTKTEGKGIGLSLSRNMVEQQGGRLTLNNRTTQGAIATITLPIRK